MGAYFSVGTAKKPRPFPLFDGMAPEDAGVTLRSGKLFAKALAGTYEGEAREAVARAFTSAIVKTYWNRIQDAAAFPFSLPSKFAKLAEGQLSEEAGGLARRMGIAAGTLEPLAAAYLIS